MPLALASSVETLLVPSLLVVEMTSTVLAQREHRMISTRGRGVSIEYRTDSASDDEDEVEEEEEEEDESFAEIL